MKLKISIDGRTYEVDVEVAEDNGASRHGAHHSRSGPASIPPPPPVPNLEVPADEEKVCRSPIVGVVVKVAVEVGQEIQVNDPLVVLEAMKMESHITSPIEGRVAAVKVRAGDGVKSGQVLVEFE